MWKELNLRGAEKEVFAVIYGFWRNKKTPVELPTIITTNLADDKILDRYGPRMMDRVKEMFSILRFKGDSYRK